MRQWRASGRAHTRIHAYARQVCATASIWNDRETETWARRRCEEEGETGRGRREEQQRAVVGCCWRWPERKQDARTGKPYVPNVKFVHGRKRVREVARGRGSNVRRSYTHIHIHIKRTRAHGPLLPTVARWSSRPSTAIEICRKCAANTRVSLENFFDLLYRPRNLSSNSPVVSNPGIRVFRPFLEKFFLWAEWN